MVSDAQRRNFCSYIYVMVPLQVQRNKLVELLGQSMGSR